MSNSNEELAKILSKYSKILTKEDLEELKLVFIETIYALKQELADEDVDWAKVPYPKSQNGVKFFEEICDLTISYKMDTEEIIGLDEGILSYLMYQYSIAK